jgi:hypothetical protein
MIPHAMTLEFTPSGLWFFIPGVVLGPIVAQLLADAISALWRRIRRAVAQRHAAADLDEFIRDALVRNGLD